NTFYNSNRQDMEPKILDNQNIEPEVLNNYDAELEILAAYDSTDDFSDIDIDNIKGHGIRIGGGGRVNTKTKKIIKRSYLCRHAGKPAKSSEVSCRVECLWKVNFWFKNEKNCIEVTTFNNEHVGHELNPLASYFDPTLRKLPKEIVEEIRFLTTIAKADATMQYRIIREKYNVRIYRPDLYKTIQMFRRDSEPGEDDAGMFLAEEKFNERWEKLLQDYPQARNYLMRSLGCCIKSWARAFTSRYFTAGVQSTSRNEGENSALKRLFGSSSLSLCELFEALEERYQEEIDYCKFVSWKQTIPQIGPKNVAKTIFEPVVRQLNEFVMPNIMKKQEEQMNLSFYYHAIEVDLEVIFSREREVDESEQCIDNLFDCPQMQLKSFLNDFSIIVESWEVMHLISSGTSHFAHILPTQFLHSEFDTNIAEEFANNNQSPDEISKAISKKRKFGELWGLGRKIMINAIENSSEELYHELLGFFTSIQNRTLPRRVISKVNDGNEFSHNINNNGCMIDIRNPVKRKSKGRPKSKRIANTFEKSDTKMSYKCKLCKKKGHNSKTCKEKSNIYANNTNGEIE
ncbi:26572_t:CDS:2, partial [Dentiscutata erythropus]